MTYNAIQNDSARNILIDIADEFQNNFLTVERFAEYHNLSLQHAESLLTLARAVRASKHTEE